MRCPLVVRGAPGSAVSATDGTWRSTSEIGKGCAMFGAVNTFRFAVNDVAVLNSLMRSIASIEGVFDVERG